jgi:AcrR family transcriptional regulator
VTPTNDRAARTRAVVLEAAGVLLLERGLSGFTIDGLVERTGIAKTTIYRHWPTRSDLAAAAIDSLGAPGVAPNVGSVRGDLLEYFIAGARALKGDLGPNAIRNLAGIVEAGRRDPAVVAAVNRAVTQMLGTVRGILERGKARGEVGPDCDLEVAANLLLGGVFIRTTFLDQDLSDDYLRAVVDAVLRSLGEE